jgi:glutathione synthase/RimK-type ligase-like ATP-grasp enzyme
MILVVAYPDEDHSTEVIRRLAAAGHETILLDLADLPSRASLSLLWEQDVPPSYVVERQGTPIDLARARVGWWRRVRPHEADPSVTDASMRAFVESETSQAVGGTLDALACVWVNDRAADEAAHHKPLQWSVAQSVGLRVPRTLVTNDVERARDFIACLGTGKVVFKAFLAMLESWRETRLIEASDLENLAAVRFAPVIFQEYVPGVDLRITIVGDQVFAAEIDARQTHYPVDMRMVVGEATVRPVALPAKLKKTLLRLQKRLGLTYGAIDMRRTADGEYVFLENNPAGQWLFVERRTELPISQAMADLLMTLDRDEAPKARS